MAAAAERAGRSAADVRIVAVTKSHPVEVAAACLAAGIVDLGENRAQELVAKAEALAAPVAEGTLPAPRWHFLGRLQRNKVGMLVPHVAWWQSIDREELADELARRAPGATVLVQVNVGDEPQKGGVAPGGVTPLVEHCRALGLDVRGLMCVPPVDQDPRPHFRGLAATAAALGLAELSMGMSDDFETAVEAGATIVRIGSALVGARTASPGG